MRDSQPDRPRDLDAAVLEGVGHGDFVGIVAALLSHWACGLNVLIVPFAYGFGMSKLRGWPELAAILGMLGSGAPMATATVMSASTRRGRVTSFLTWSKTASCTSRCCTDHRCADGLGVRGRAVCGKCGGTGTDAQPSGFRRSVLGMNIAAEQGGSLT
jgi:hypothetical protein